jgi:hypothetical protein
VGGNRFIGRNMSFVVEPHGSYFMGDELRHLPPVDVKAVSPRTSTCKEDSVRSAESASGKPKKPKRRKKKKTPPLSYRAQQELDRYTYDLWVIEQHKLAQQLANKIEHEDDALHQPSADGRNTQGEKVSKVLQSPKNYAGATKKPMPPAQGHSKRISKARQSRTRQPCDSENVPLQQQPGKASPSRPKTLKRRSYKPVGVPFSKAKAHASEVLAEEVTKLKNQFNSIKLKGDTMEKELKRREKKYNESLQIGFRGIQFDELNLKDALSPKKIVAKKLHQLLHSRLSRFLYDFFQATPPITRVDELVVDIVGHPEEPISSEIHDELFSGLSMDEVLVPKQRTAILKLIEEGKRWEAQLNFVLERENLFRNRVSGQIEDFNHHISKIKEDIKLSKTNLLELQKLFDSGKITLTESTKTLEKARKRHALELDRLAAEAEDSAVWTAEVDKMSGRRERVAKMFKDDLIAKKMAQEAREQDMKRALLQAKREQEERRLAPYREAATRIYNLTGIQDVDHILESFETWEGKQQNMISMIEQKENHIQHTETEIVRLRRLIEQSKTFGGEPTGDQKRLGMDVYQSKLQEAMEEANMARLRAHAKFITKRDALIGLSSCATKVGVDVAPPRLEEEPVQKFVMPTKERRRSITSSMDHSVTQYDKVREEREIASVDDILSSIEERIRPMVTAVVENLKSLRQKGQAREAGHDRDGDTFSSIESIDNDVAMLEPHAAGTKFQQGSAKEGSRRGSRAPSRIASLDGGVSMKEDDEPPEVFVTDSDVKLLLDTAQQLPPPGGEGNVRIKARKVIVREYLDAKGVPQYDYEYISEDDEAGSNKDDKSTESIATQNESPERQEWKNVRKESRERSISIADIYKRRSSSSVHADPTKMIFDQDWEIEDEFKNLDMVADFTKQTMSFEHDVVQMSKLARRQSGSWRKKIKAQKAQEDALRSISSSKVKKRGLSVEKD